MNRDKTTLEDCNNISYTFSTMITATTTLR